MPIGIAIELPAIKIQPPVPARPISPGDVAGRRVCGGQLRLSLPERLQLPAAGLIAGAARGLRGDAIRTDVDLLLLGAAQVVQPAEIFPLELYLLGALGLGAPPALAFAPRCPRLGCFVREPIRIARPHSCSSPADPSAPSLRLAGPPRMMRRISGRRPATARSAPCSPGR